MTRWAPEKHDTVGALADEILHNYGQGRVFVAVDGPDRAAAATFADDLAVAFGETGHAAFRASLDSFVPAAESTVDETTLRRILVEPFRAGGSTPWAPAPSPDTAQVTSPRDAVLVVDAALDGRAELAGLWNYAVWVVGSEVADRRAEGRGRATAVIDNTDPEHPRRLFDDAC